LELKVRLEELQSLGVKIMSKKVEKDQKEEKEKDQKHKTRGWVGKGAGAEGVSSSLDKDLENALKKDKKKEK
jgi:hypothetical protein